MERKWMTTTAGILNIFTGVSGIVGGILLIVLAIISGFLMEYVGNEIPQVILVVIFLVAGIPCIIFGALALTGGIFCLRRKNWGWALAGSISSFFINKLFGIAAIVFTALSRKEFNQTS